MTKGKPDIRLGLGLIGIGREWGFQKSAVPDEKSVREFLEYAYNLGITFFDTAASYGTSEERFGAFLNSLSLEQRNSITVATKFGDHWNSESQSASIDHTFNALKESLDRSLRLLGRIDIVQLHRPNPAALKSEDVLKAFEYARTCGIPVTGASVSDSESGTIACNNDLFSVIQIPFNAQNKKLEMILDLAIIKNKILLINRPFNMGASVHAEGTSPEVSRTQAFRMIVEKRFKGVVLTGTKSPHHLKENRESFQEAMHCI